MGQISLTDETQVTRDFDNFRGAGFTPSPGSGQLDSDELIATGLSDGDLSFGDTGDSGDFARGESTGGVGTGGIYAFDTGSGDFSLGVQPTGSDFTAGTIVAQYKNKTGGVITSFDLSYGIEVFNNAGRANSFNSAYAIGSCGSKPSSGNFTNLGMDFTSPEAADGSPTWNTTTKSTTVSPVSIPDGECLFVRFQSDDVSGSGSRDELALNDLNVTPTLDPSVQFTAGSGTVGEDDNSTALAVEILNAPGRTVDVDVEMTTAPSGSGDDFSNFPSETDSDTTVTFGANVQDSTVQSVPLEVVEDGETEGAESATFTLKNPSGSANIGTSSQFGLTIKDAVSNHAGDVLITEMSPNPGGSDGGKEYVELYNATGSDITLDGWTLREQGGDDDDLSGVTVPARGFSVLCEDDDPSSNGGVINCDIDYLNGITLLNGGDTIIIEDDTGSEVDRVSYDGGTDWPDPNGQAMIFTGTTDNNNGDNWVLATERERGYTQSQSGDNGSPGRNGTDQILQPTTEITGGAGWRMLSAPMGGITPEDLAAVSLVQGIPGLPFDGEDANLYQWPGGTDSNADWSSPSGASTDLTGSGAPSGGAGGYIWFVFDAAETKFTDTPPFTLSLPGAPRASNRTTGSLGDGFHLLGNPFAQSYDVSGLGLETKNFQTTVQVWDPSADSYKGITQSRTSTDVLAPYQGFFVECVSNNGCSGNALTLDAGGRRPNPIGIKSDDHAPPRVDFQLVGKDEEGLVITHDEALTLHAPENSTVGWDVHDASKLTPLSSRYATVAFRGSVDGSPRLQSVASIPSSLPEGGIKLPISLQLQGTDPVESFSFSWPTWTSVPDQWGLALHDTVADTTINLRTQSSYTFVLPASKAQSVSPPRFPLEVPAPIRAKAQSENARFTLTVQPNPVPVELAAFEAAVSNKIAQLRWTTASETNNAGFQVEHRAPEAEDFASTGFVEGHGTTDQPQQYRFRTDPLSPGRHVFRLRQVDLDGTATRSDTVAVQVRLSEAVEMEVVPNPIRTRATVSLRVRDDLEVNVVLYDVLGRRVRTLHEGAMAARRTHTLRVDMDGLSSGLYLLRADAEQFQTTRRVTVVR